MYVNNVCQYNGPCGHLPMIGNCKMPRPQGRKHYIHKIPYCMPTMYFTHIAGSRHTSTHIHTHTWLKAHFYTHPHTLGSRHTSTHIPGSRHTSTHLHTRTWLKAHFYTHPHTYLAQGILSLALTLKQCPENCGWQRQLL